MTDLTDKEAQIPQSSPGVSTDRARPIKYKMPSIPENATPQYFIDELGKFTRARGRLQKVEKYLKDSFKQRYPGLSEGKGDVFDFKLSTSTQTRISADKCREHLTEEQLKQVSYDLTISSMRFKKTDEGWDDLSDDEIDSLGD